MTQTGETLELGRVIPFLPFADRQWLDKQYNQNYLLYTSNNIIVQALISHSLGVRTRFLNCRAVEQIEDRRHAHATHTNGIMRTSRSNTSKVKPMENKKTLVTSDGWVNP